MIRCLAIDDEPLSLDLLEDNIRQVPSLHLVGRCAGVDAALEVMRRDSVELLFVDIEMPGLSGLDFLRGLAVRPLVVLVTAYRHYAQEGFELDVVDYLVKPVRKERFLRAVDKVIKAAGGGGAGGVHAGRGGAGVGARAEAETPETPAGSAAADYFFVNVEYNLVRIMIDDIAYIEALGDYIKIWLTSAERPVICKLSMRTLAGRLPAGRYVRIHKSYIVAVGKIEFIRKNRVQVKGELLPVSEHFREALLGVIGPNYWR